MSLTIKIKDKYGSLKHYAKIRGINYQYLRNQLSANKLSTNIEKILKEDGFIKDTKEIA